MISVLLLLNSPFAWMMFLLGAFVGSFLNVVILRVPEGTFFSHVRSVCPRCETLIPFYFNIPIFGWMILRGKSACCKTKISVQYPIVELVTALFFFFAYGLHQYCGYSLSGNECDQTTLIRYLHVVVFFSIMFACSVIDFRLMIIPDKISLPTIALSPLVAMLHPDLTLVDSLLGAALGAGVLYSIAWIYWIIKKQYGIGFGDVKLLAAIGGWLGYQAILPTIFIGSIVGSIIGIGVLLIGRQFSWEAKIPFGPFLSLGAIAHLCFGPSILAMLGF